MDICATPIHQYALGQGTPSIGVHISACWYASLACSLLSAFGGLLSKQWVIHYASRPLWANTVTLQCRLRELRHEGHRKWRVGWFVDSLVILLQLSVLAFAVGLVAHLHKTSLAHFIITLSVTAFALIAYASTLIAGTFIPECPFKSTITGYAYKLLIFFALALPHAAIWTLIWLGRLFGILCGFKKLSQRLRAGSLWLEANASRIDRLIVTGNVEKEAVENGTAGAAGVLCWWLVQENSEHAEDNVDIKTVADKLTSFPAQVVISLVSHAQSFTFWSSNVIDNLQSLPLPSSPSRNYHLQMAELLCDLMHRSLVACTLALKAAKSDVLNHEGKFCSILRAAWCNGRSSNALPITLMRWPTVSLYLQLQLRSWSSLPDHGDTLDQVGMIRDLSVIIQDSRLKETEDIANAIALVALVLENGDIQIDTSHRVIKLFYWQPAERLLQAFHLLSTYPSHNLPNELVLSAVRISANKISNCLDDDLDFLTSCHCWWNGDIVGTLLRLLRLGHSWRCQDVPAQVELGEKLTNEVLRVMSRVVAYLVASRAIPPEWFIILLDEGLTTILRSYSHPSTNSSPNLDALRVIDFVLGLRSYRPQSASRRYLPWIDQETPSTPPGAAITSIATDYPLTIAQLIHNIGNSGPLSEERRIILSVLVKGRQIFFVPDVVPMDESLQQALDSLETQVLQSGNPLMPVEEACLHTFNHWDEITAVLRQLEQESLEKGAM